MDAKRWGAMSMSGELQANEELRLAVGRELALRFDGVGAAHFLAAGEYTLNYRAALPTGDVVLRLVTGSQMGLEPGPQVRYEAHALDLLARTGRVPRLIAVEDRADGLPCPYLLIEFLPGRPLDYARDIERAAVCVAAIHRNGVPGNHRLQDHRDPVRSIFDEVDWLIGDAPGKSNDMAERWAQVRQLADQVRAVPAEAFGVVSDDLAIINTDLNSHNFIVDGERTWLIDWEKARIGPTVLDLAHFLLPTTTLWRDATATRLTPDDEERFVAAYLNHRPELDGDCYRRALRSMKRLAALRAVAWCAWALATSERNARAIENAETLAKCRLFTSPAFLDELSDNLWG